MSHTIDHERMSQKQIVTYYHVKIANHFMELAELHTTHWNEIDPQITVGDWMEIGDNKINIKGYTWTRLAWNLFETIGNNMYGLNQVFDSPDIAKIADWGHHYNEIAEAMTEISYFMHPNNKTNEYSNGQNHDTNR